MISAKNYFNAVKYSLVMLPISVFALSRLPQVSLQVILLILLALHAFIFVGVFMAGQSKEFNSVYVLISLIGVGLLSILAIKSALLATVFVLFYVLYFHPSTRFRKLSFIAYLLNIILCGPLVFAIAVYAVPSAELSIYFLAIQAVAFMVGAVIPMLQLHVAPTDAERGDATIAVVFSPKRVLILSTTMMVIGNIFMLLYFFTTKHLLGFYIWLLCFAPIAAFYTWWSKQIKQNVQAITSQITQIYLGIVAVCMSIFSLLALLLKL
jgi:hypothetical protein